MLPLQPLIFYHAYYSVPNERQILVVRSYFFEKPIQRKYGVRSEDHAVDCHFAMDNVQV